MSAETVAKYLLETHSDLQLMRDRAWPKSRLTRRTGRHRHPVGTSETAAQTAFRQRIGLHIIGLARQRQFPKCREIGYLRKIYAPCFQKPAVGRNLCHASVKQG